MKIQLLSLLKVKKRAKLRVKTQRMGLPKSKKLGERDPRNN